MRARTPTHALTLALASACLALAGFATASPAAASFRFGLSDYEASTFSDPRVAELGVHLARDVLPWNVAYSKRDLALATAWLDAVRHAYHITPFITFQHADNFGPAPSPAQYLRAFLRFRKRFPWVKEFSPMDEATHATQPTERHPKLAAEYYNELASHCPGCEIAAPDILDSDGNVEAWVETFLQTARPQPAIWPFNPYASVSTDNPAPVERFLTATKGQVWFSEVGGVVWWRFKGHLIQHSEAYAARVAQNTFRFARLSSRITRVYYYHWRSPGNPHRLPRRVTWDSGLIRSNGSPRPALLVVARELHRYIQKLIPKIF
ncbi:MAG TPA: hypothetical protein VIG42_05725 [Solirubrobacteraceae bacterium]